MKKRNIVIIIIAVIVIAIVGIWFYISSLGFLIVSPKDRTPKEQAIKLDQSILHAKGILTSRVVTTTRKDEYGNDVKSNTGKVEMEYYIILNKEGKVTETIAIENLAEFDKQAALERAKEIYTFIYQPRLEGDKIIYKFSFWNGEPKEKIIEYINVMENAEYTII